MNKSLLNLAGALLLAAVLLVLLFGWLDKLSAGSGADREVRRTFVIALPPEVFPALERAPVEFGHELHTGAMPEAKCTTCHEEGEEGALVYRFYDEDAGLSAVEITESYHQRCMSCHEERGQGPEACGECHVKLRRYRRLPWSRVELDLRQHDLHIVHMGEVLGVAREETCRECHHVRDEATGELRYVKGEESTCRDCHLREETDGVPSLREVAHARCITCHRREEAPGARTGPIQCGGCHDAGLVSPAVVDMTDVPRLDRGQKATLFLTLEDEKMGGVPFNHENHERHTRNCRTCHHESLRGCDECHTLAGKEEGGGVRLADAFHRVESPRSCVGCHEQQKKVANCRVCHIAMPPGPADASCDVCHTGTKAVDTGVRAQRDPATLLPDDLPERISIKTLADRFEPVDFPHRDIVVRLNELLGDSHLANVFHGDRAVVCSACHHHSPLGQSPPPCSRCHQDPFDPRALSRPGLKGAYHRQCIDCHEVLRVLGDYRDCAACHKDEVPMPGRPAGAARGEVR